MEILGSNACQWLTDFDLSNLVLCVSVCVCERERERLFTSRKKWINNINN